MCQSVFSSAKTLIIPAWLNIILPSEYKMNRPCPENIQDKSVYYLHRYPKKKRLKYSTLDHMFYSKWNGNDDCSRTKA